jgi:glycosyltransferase involved in cell wall biosynthesis
MHIAYDHQIFSSQRYGGISRYYVELSCWLARMPGNQVSVVCPAYINEHLPRGTRGPRVLGKRVPHIRYTTLIRGRINYSLARSTMARLQPDIVHETYYASKPAAPPGTPVVLTVFDMIHELFPECFGGSDPTRRNKVQAITRADHVICISEQTRTDLVNLLDVDPDKTTVVHLGFSLRGTPGKATRHGSRPFILYVGNRSGYKNFSALMHAYAIHAEVRNGYKIIAFGGGPFGPEERSLIKELGIEANQVRQLNGSDDILATLYKEASLLVYPSLYEGFGIPPLEAMSFGCPVVCSNSSSLPEVVGNAAETFDPASADALGAAIERVLSDSTLRRTLVERGYERIRLFSWEKCADETSSVYRRLLS